jgi:hypothetical protein
MNRLIRYFRANWESILIEAILLQFFIAGILDGNLIFATIAAVAGLALLALIYKTIAIFDQCLKPLRGQNIAFQVPRRGLVFTVGLQPETIRLAVKHQKPGYVGFICSAKSEPIVSRLMEEFNCDEDNCIKKMVNSNDIKDIRTETGLILDWMISKGLKPSDIAADITGGTTTMSVGVFSMTEERNVDSQYIFCRQYENNRCVDGTQEAVFVSRYS